MSTFDGASRTPSGPGDGSGGFDPSTENPDDLMEGASASDDLEGQKENAELRELLSRSERERQRLLNERTNAENDRRQAELIWKMVENRVEQPGEDPQRVQRLMAAAHALRESDDDRDLVTVELGRELERTRRELAQMQREIRSVSTRTRIPVEQQERVDAIMQTGAVASEEDALKVLNQMDAMSKKREPEGDRGANGGEPPRARRAERVVVGTGTPPSPRLPASGPARLKREYEADEYRGLLEANPERRSEIIRAVREGRITIRS